MTKVTIYTDGGARGNPGPAGAGAVVVSSEGKVLKEASAFLGACTNNWAEYEAVAFGLKEVKKLFGKRTRELEVEVKLDSELVAEQLTGNYQVKEESLFPQFIKVHNLRVKDFPRVTFTHIPREQNKKADRLANEAMSTRASGRSDGNRG